MLQIDGFRHSESLNVFQGNVFRAECASFLFVLMIWAILIYKYGNGTFYRCCMETVKRMDGRLPLYVFETLRLPSGMD